MTTPLDLAPIEARLLGAACLTDLDPNAKLFAGDAAALLAEVRRLHAENAEVRAEVEAPTEADALLPFPEARPKPSDDVLQDAASILHSAEALEAGAEEAGFDDDAYVVRRVRILAEALLAERERLTAERDALRRAVERFRADGKATRVRLLTRERDALKEQLQAAREGQARAERLSDQSVKEYAAKYEREMWAEEKARSAMHRVDGYKGECAFCGVDESRRVAILFTTWGRWCGGCDMDGSTQRVLTLASADRRITDLEARVAWLTDEAAKVEAERDEALAALEGAKARVQEEERRASVHEAVAHGLRQQRDLLHRVLQSRYGWADDQEVDREIRLLAPWTADAPPHGALGVLLYTAAPAGPAWPEPMDEEGLAEGWCRECMTDLRPHGPDTRPTDDDTAREWLCPECGHTESDTPSDGEE